MFKKIGTVVICGILLTACADKKSDKKVVPPEQTAPLSDVTGASEDSSVLLKVQKDGTIDSANLKKTLSEKYPETTKQCLELAKKLNGTFSKWDFKVESWMLSGSKSKLTTNEMVKNGYNVTYRLYPQVQVLEMNESNQQLKTQMDDGNLVKEVLWDVYPLSTEKCAFVQDVNQKELFLINWVFIQIPPNQNISEPEFRALFTWFDTNGKYSAEGSVIFQRPAAE